MLLRVGQRQRRSPRTTEHQPSVDLQLPAQSLEIGHQMPRGVDGQVGAVRDMRDAATAATLVDQDDPVDRRIEHPPVGRVGASSGPAVHEHDRRAVRAAGALPVQLLAVAHVEHPRLMRFDLRIRRPPPGAPFARDGVLRSGVDPVGGHQKECSGPGKARERTSSPYSRAASRRVSRQPGVLLDELRRAAGPVTGHVLPHEHLGVAAVTAPIPTVAISSSAEISGQISGDHLP